jgi:hypothetical protein
MRKTLLIAGAALAASIISSQAQTVYSQNIVGYINQTIPAGKYQIVGSQLINGSDLAQTNGDINATLGNGLISSPVPITLANPTQDPNLSTNTQILVYVPGSGLVNYFYFNAADATAWEGSASPAGWYTAGGAPASVFLANGLSAFIYNHSSSPLTLTTVGTVFQGTNVTQIRPGFNLVCLQPAIATNLVTDASGNPLPYGLPVTLNSSNCISTYLNAPTTLTQDYILYWNGTSYVDFFYFNQDDATAWENSYGAGPTYPAGFYDAGGNSMAQDGAAVTVNQGFFLWHQGATTINWTNAFTVQ